MHAAKLLVAAAVSLTSLAACSYYYSVGDQVEPEAVILAEATPAQDYLIRICYEGEGEPNIDAAIDAYVSNGVAAEVTLTLDDASRVLTMERHNPSTLYANESDLVGACEGGFVASFEVAPGATVEPEITWTVRGSAWSDIEPAVEEGELSVIVEALD